MFTVRSTTVRCLPYLKCTLTNDINSTGGKPSGKSQLYWDVIVRRVSI